MKPLRLTIEGIGPFLTETVVDLDVPSPIAIVAAKGSGKTFIVESIPAALYGQFAWYGNIYDAMSIHGAGQAQIELEFKADGTFYTARRILRVTPKTRLQEAWLFKGETQIAGPKVSDTNAAIERLCGPLDTFLATSFLAQNRQCDLIGQPGTPALGARRREVFGELLDFGPLDAIADRVAEAWRDLERRLAKAEALLKAMPDVSEADLEAAQKAVAVAKDAETVAKDARSEAAVALDAAGAGVVTATAAVTQARKILTARESIAAACGQLAQEQQGLCEQKQRLQATLATAEAVMADVFEREALLKERDALQAQAVEWKNYSALLRHRNELRNTVGSVASAMSRISHTSMTDDSCEALAKTADAKRKALAQYKADHEAERAATATIRANKSGAESRLNAHDAELTAMQARAAALPETPGGAFCDTCELLAAYRSLPEQIERMKRTVAHDEAEVAEAHVQILAGETRLTELAQTIAEQRSRVEAANAAETRVRTNSDIHEAIKTGEAALQKARRDLEKHDAMMESVVEVADPSPDLNRVQERLEALGGAPERQDAVDTARAEMELLGPRITALDERLELMQHDLQVANEKCSDTDIAALEQRERDADTTLAEAKTAHNNASVYIEALIRATADAEHHIELLVQHASARKDQRALYDELTERAAGCADLRQCFGPHGVRQLLIDGAAPELEAIANDLFRAATHGSMTLRIATQRLNRDGSIAEDLAILVTDAKGERDAQRFSGSEGQLVRILFRLAVAQWSSHRLAAPIETLVLDEAFDSLGAEGSEELLQALGTLDNIGTTMLLITHDDEIAGRMPSRLRVETNGYLAKVTAE